ncbi:hypothetical protein LCGC14_1268590 [marine sediment metagenome]|uniref:Uncharacterized protein n=1 Tax=marine sediment metagenome TaxID=412755 RepID=A0A0F9LJP4_9ZZZZ
MPKNIRHQINYLGPNGTFADFNESSLYYAGALGQRNTGEAKDYQLVQLDSGATASASTGVVATGDLAFWKAKAPYLVTNDIAQALGPAAGSNVNKRNAVAGVFLSAITAGNFCWIQQGGRASVLAASGGTYAVGNVAIAGDTTASDITTITAGTDIGFMVVGLVAGVRAAGVAPVDLTLPGIP